MVLGGERPMVPTKENGEGGETHLISSEAYAVP